MKTQRTILSLAMATVAFTAGHFPTHAQAAPYNLPSVPLIVSIDAVPNVWFQLDDSGSMDWEILAGPHFPSCRYNPVLQCTDSTPPSQGRMQIWTGEWDDGNDKPEITTNAYIFDLGTDDHRYSSNCDVGTGNGGAWGDCWDDYGDSGSRRQNNRTRNFDIDRDWRLRSSSVNVLYFNPEETYEPWASSETYTFGNASFTNARSWPVSGETGYSERFDLNSDDDEGPFFYHYWLDGKGWNSGHSAPRANSVNMTNGSNGIVDQWDDHIKVTVSTGGITCEKVTYNPQNFSWPGSRAGINPTVTTASTAECNLATAGQSASQLRQNVANWFQYYRRRTHVARAAVGNVVAGLPEFRYGTASINQDGSSTTYAIPDSVITDYEANTKAMLDVLYNTNRSSSGTPLRRGLERIGEIYADDDSDYDSPIILSCQKNFTLLFSDGFWNGGDPGTPSNDVDGDGQTVGGENVTLADVAMHFYETDLRSDLEDAVPTDSFDSANWQHMVTYTIAFGLQGTLVDTDDDGWPNPPLDSDDDWYRNGNDVDKVEDMWHAAWNSKGQYFNAQRPEELYQDVRDALSNIASRIGGAASAAANSGSISSTSRIFQAKFDTADWHGELLAYPVNNDGTLGATAVWNANDILNGKSNSELASNSGGRDVWTWNNDSTTPTGTAFEWSSISSSQQGHLNKDWNGATDSLGQERLRYIRGDSSDEIDHGGTFRNRINRLGDVVNSDPLYIGYPPFFYSFSNYQTFFNSHKNRTGVIYIGANDGMLHAIRESDGEELFAYVPDKVIPNLPLLTNPDYEHTFFVDGPPAYGDIETTAGWKSVLAGSLRSGGQGIYALDVTSPTTFSASNVLWEFTDEVDADLGYTFGEPQIKKMANGKWAVIIGNGINNTEADGNASSTGAGALFILFIEAGVNGWSVSDYKKIVVPGGSAADPNAVFTPAAADVDGDHLIDFIYAGDRFGKMWKFDVSNSDPVNWDLAFGGNPLFATQTGQPITDRPAIAAHPLGRRLGQLVIFGTGAYIQVSDNIATGYPSQSLYAIWDFDEDWATEKSISTGDLYGNSRSELSQATFTDQTGGVRTMGGSEVSWLDGSGDPDHLGWYVDLPTDGERIVRRTVLRDNIVFFVTLIPDTDSCSAGGTGWIMAMDMATGQAPTFPVFDIDGDLDVSRDGDTYDSGTPGDPTDDLIPVGIKSPSIPNLPAMIYDDRANFTTPAPFPPEPNQARGCDAGSARAYTFTTGSNGSIQAVETATESMSCGRQSWRRER